MASSLAYEKYDITLDLQGDPRGCALLFASKIPLRYSLNDFGAAPFCTRTWQYPKQIAHQLFRYEYLFEKVFSTRLPEFSKPIWPTQQNKLTKDIELKKNQILIHPGASLPKRRWSSTLFAQLLDLCKQANFDIVLIGGPGDKVILDDICKKTTGKITYQIPTFTELEILFSQSECVVCNDSFAGHAAWACNTKSVILFGPGNPHQVAPFTGKHFIIWNDTILSPPFSTWKGPEDINKNSVETVFSAVKLHCGYDT